MIQLSFNPFPDLLTDRLLLRSFQKEDKEAVLALRSDPTVAKYLNRPLMQQETAAIEYIDKMKKGVRDSQWIIWAISLIDGPLIGSICLWNIRLEEVEAEVGYELLPAFQGHGFMQAALKVVLDYGFQQMNLQQIRAISDARNQPSLRLLEKYGFVQDRAGDNKEDLLLSYLLSIQDYGSRLIS